MTNEKVIKTLSGAYDLLLQCHVRFEFMCEFKEALQIATEALGKQIQKKPRLIRREYIPETYEISYEMWECPCCEKTYYITEGYDEEFLHCSKCGQYLGDEWTEV